MIEEVKAIGKVGKKGELYPPRKVREVAGLTPGGKVLYIARKNRIEIIPIKSFKEVFKEKPIVKISMKEFEELTGELIESL